MGIISVVRNSKNQPRKWVTRFERFDALSSYIKAGFHITPLHSITEGVCSCRSGKECGAAGKHPRFNNWQNPDSPGHIFTQSKLDALFRRNALSNWGLVTGKVSGVFVIDIDAKSNGYETLAGLEAQYGKLPPTLAASTGGGGKHYLFRYPTDGSKIKNDSGKLLGPGIDVRSDRGQVVVYPSVHKSGNRYVWDSPVGSTPIAEAPAWLLEKLTQEPRSEVAPLTPEQVAQYKLQHEKTRNVRTSSRRYVEAALRNEVNKVLNSAPDTHNDTLNKAAFSLGGYIATGLLDEYEVRDELLRAGVLVGQPVAGANATISSGFKRGMANPKVPPERVYEDDFNEFGDLSGITLEHADSLDALKMTEAEEREFDRIFGEAMERELELQKDPVAYQNHLDELRAQHDAQDEAFQVALARDREKRRIAQERLDAAMAALAKGTIPFHRCEKCPPNKSHRPCPACTKKLGVTRDRPADVPCSRGGSFAVQPKDPARYGQVTLLRTKCCMWGCPKCGYDNECDHLAHMQTYTEWMKDILDSPKLCIPSHDIEDSSVKEVDIQPGCWKAIVPDEVRRRYSTKLSKMGVYFVADYVGEDNYAFYCFLPMGFKSDRLNYKPLDVNNRPLPAVVAERIPFSEFQRQHRLHLSNAGRYIKLSKSDWDTCDAAPGARLKHVAVSYCRALRMPKRMVTNNQNTFLGKSVLDDAAVVDLCDEFGVTHSLANTRDIDRSHRRGLTQRLLKFWRFEFPPAASRERIEAFIARLTGRDKIIEYAEEKAQQYTGSSCLSYPLVT